MTLLTTNLLPTQSVPFGPQTGKTGLRHLLKIIGGDLQEGVFAAGDYKVTQRAAGVNMSVDVAAGDALIQGDDTARQGMYHQHNDATVNLVVAANASGNPRFDQVVLHVYDSSIAGGSDTPQIELLQGTPTVGATTDNRLGAAALPNNAIRLAEFVTANGAASIASSIIRDRRPWASGALDSVFKTSGNLTTTSATVVNLDATNLYPRLELTGVPCRVSLSSAGSNSVAGNYLSVGAYLDGAWAQSGGPVFIHAPTANYYVNAGFSQVFTPSPGTHRVGVGWYVGAGTGTLLANTNQPLQLIVEELVRQNIDNSGA